MLINVKMPTIVGILTFMSRINFMLSWVEHGKSFITFGQVLSREIKCPAQGHNTVTSQSQVKQSTIDQPLCFPSKLIYLMSWAWPMFRWRNKRIHKCNSELRLSLSCHVIPFSLCMLGNFSCLYCCLLTFFKSYIFKTLFQEHYQCQKVWIQIRTEILLVLIWV